MVSVVTWPIALTHFVIAVWAGTGSWRQRRL